MNKTEIKTTLMLASIYMTRMLGLFLIFPTFSVLAQDLPNATPTKIGLALGIYSLAQAILQIPMGWLSDIMGRKKVLYLGLGLFFGGSVLAAASHDINTLIFARLLQGMGAVSAVCLAYVGDSIRPSEQGKAMMLIGMAIGSAFMLAFVLGSVISQHWGLSGLFLTTALLAVLALFLAKQLPEPPQRLSSVNVSTFKATVVNQQLLAVNLQAALLHMTLSASFFLLPIILKNKQVDWLYLTAYIIPLIFTAIIVAPLARQRDRGVALLPYFWCLLALALVIMARFSVFDATATLIVAMTLFFSGFTLIETLLPTRLLQFAEAQSRGASSGIFSLYQFSGNFLGGLLGAKCYTLFTANGTIQTSFYILAAPTIAVAVASMLSIHHTTTKVNHGKQRRQ